MSDSTNGHSRNQTLPDSAKLRKQIPIAAGFMFYFPDAIAAVAKLSFIGNEQHNPGKHLHWDRAKSGDELEALSRHLLRAGLPDKDGVPESVKVAWRAMAHLQKEVEANPETYRAFFNLDTVASENTAQISLDPKPSYGAAVQHQQPQYELSRPPRHDFRLSDGR